MRKGLQPSKQQQTCPTPKASSLANFWSNSMRASTEQPSSKQACRRARTTRGNPRCGHWAAVFLRHSQWYFHPAGQLKKRIIQHVHSCSICCQNSSLWSVLFLKNEPTTLWNPYPSLTQYRRARKGGSLISNPCRFAESRHVSVPKTC